MIIKQHETVFNMYLQMNTCVYAKQNSRDMIFCRFHKYVVENVRKVTNAELSLHKK